MMISITSRRAAVLFALAGSLLTCSVVSVAIVLLYPPEELLWELSLSITLSFGLTFTMCHWVGIQMFRNYQLTAELRRLVERDRLSDVATRDYFFARLEEDESAYGVSLMVDIDHFKRVNDTYGHLAGDEVIRRVAGLLKSQVRERDIVCRFGGEEFVIFLHEVSADEGWQVAERVREVVAEEAIAVDGEAVKVTVSIGGSLKSRAEEIDVAVQRADACLYQAKEAGRNRTVVDWLRSGRAGARDAVATP